MIRKFMSSMWIAALAGCTLVPSAGPSSISYSQSATDSNIPAGSDQVAQGIEFALVDMTEGVLDTVRQRRQTPLGSFTDRRPPVDLPLGVGDTVKVTIYEAAAGGLFVPANSTLSRGNNVELPDQQIDRSGLIKVPYAGMVRAAGRRTSEVQNEIERKLSSRAIEPQVVISIVNRQSTVYTVTGDVTQGGRFPINLNGDRILDALGNAQGPKFPDFETQITLQRGSQKATTALTDVINSPASNIFLRPGDIVTVRRDQKFFVVLGATRENRHIAFDRGTLSLADGLAKAGGLDDTRADPVTVVVYRVEPRALVQTLGIDVRKFGDRKDIPVAYRLNLRDPSGPFAAQNFGLQHQDLIFISTHPSVDLLKFNDMVRSYFNTAYTARSAIQYNRLVN
jgi:polysaccharide biosynthesis/export protein